MSPASLHAPDNTPAWGANSIGVANDFFLCALDGDRATATLVIEGRVLGLGLAAALLGELLFSEHIEIHDDVIEIVTDRVTVPADHFQQFVLGTLMCRTRRGPLKLPQMLELLGAEAEALVSDRLAKLGWISKVVYPRRFRRGATHAYYPIDTSHAVWRPMRLCAVMAEYKFKLWDDILLAGLAMSTDLTTRVQSFQSSSDRMIPNIRNILAVSAEQDPSVLELVSQVHALVGAAAYAPPIS